MGRSEDAKKGTSQKSTNKPPQSRTLTSKATDSQRTTTTGCSAVARPSRTHLRGGFCEPDPLDPDRVPCDAKVEHEDRQGISHFFGRNKRATSTIPTSCYPLLCRNHYQERKYRMRETPWIEAGQQCDAIAITMKRMSEVTWTDAKGFVWPRWSAFELQLCHNPIEDKEEGDEDVEDEDETPAPPAKKRKSTADTKIAVGGDDSKPARKQRAKPAPAPVPEWLQKLCSAETLNQTAQFNHVGERGGARYNFDDMAKIVRHIKSYCLREKSRLPSVEALPVTAGLQAEADIRVAKIDVEDRNKDYNRARHELYQAQENDRDMRGPQNVVMMKQVELNAAKEKLKLAKDMLAWCKETLPDRRVPKKRDTKRESDVPSVEDDNDEDDSKMDVGEDDLKETPALQQRGRAQRESKRVPAEIARPQAADSMDIDLDENEALPSRRGGRKPRPSKIDTPVSQQRQDLSDDDIFPPRRIQGPSRQPRPADANTKTTASSPVPSLHSANLASPATLSKRLLLNKKKPTPLNSPSTPSKPAATRSAPTPTSVQHGTALRPPRTGSMQTRTPVARRTPVVKQDDSDDDVILTGVVATPLGKRKRPPPKLAAGVTAESDTDGDTDVGY